MEGEREGEREGEDAVGNRDMAMPTFCSVFLFLTISAIVRAESAKNSRNPVSCPLSNKTTFTVNFVVDPPYVTKIARVRNGKTKQGIMYDFARMGITECFHSFKCSMKQVNWVAVNSTFLNTSIVDGQTDVAFAIHPSATPSFPSSPLVTFLTPLHSPGLAFIVDYDACTKDTERLTVNTLLSAVWPNFSFTLLLAGISGIFIWALVNIVVYNSLVRGQTMQSTFSIPQYNCGGVM